MQRYFLFFLPMFIYGLCVKFFLSLLIIFLSFLGPKKDNFFIQFQEWIYEYGLFIVLFSKLFILLLFFQFSISRGSRGFQKNPLFQVNDSKWQFMWKHLQSLPTRTSLVTWPIFYILVFAVYFILYPISFHSKNLINWDDALSGYFYVSIFLFVSVLCAIS